MDDELRVKVKDILVFNRSDGSYIGKLSEMEELTEDMVIDDLKYAPSSEYSM